MEIIVFIINLFEIIVFAYLGLAAFYILFFSVAGLFPYQPKVGASLVMRKIAVLIPGYKEDSVIIDVAQNTLKQDYPKDLFEVIVIADSFREETNEMLKALPVRVIMVAFNKSTKSKALNAAMEVIDDHFDIAVILDADNMMKAGFLGKINDAFNAGFKVVQGHRMAKNMNNTLALLDTISEEINNHIFRKGHRVAGLSSALIGSGMAFEYDFFKKTMNGIKAIGGFDKELELTLLRDGIRIEYLEHAIVLDEKVQKEAVFENQRRRWLSAQFVYFRRFAWDGLVQFIRRFNIDYLDKIYQMVQPPRILLLGILTIITMLSGFLSLFAAFRNSEIFAIPVIYWLVIWLFTAVALLLSVPAKLYNYGTFKALLSLPRGFWLMLRSLFKLRHANKAFIHTQHGVEEKANKEI